jgi:hypothetical protein
MAATHHGVASSATSTLIIPPGARPEMTSLSGCSVSGGRISVRVWLMVFTRGVPIRRGKFASKRFLLRSSRPTRASHFLQRAEDRHAEAFSGMPWTLLGPDCPIAAAPRSCLNRCHPRPLNGDAGTSIIIVGTIVVTTIIHNPLKGPGHTADGPAQAAGNDRALERPGGSDEDRGTARNGL